MPLWQGWNWHDGNFGGSALQPLYPTYKKIARGDPISMTTGFRGGLSSRTEFVIAEEHELPEGQKDYLDRMAKPYFSAVARWLETAPVPAGKRPRPDSGITRCFATGWGARRSYRSVFQHRECAVRVFSGRTALKRPLAATPWPAPYGPWLPGFRDARAHPRLTRRA